MRLVRSAAAAQRHNRRRSRIVRPVVLAEAEDVEADLIGQLDLLDQVAQALMRADMARGPARADVGESVEAEFHDACLSVAFVRASS